MTSGLKNGSSVADARPLVVSVVCPTVDDPDPQETVKLAAQNTADTSTRGAP
jgi:hypothetical protein